MKPQLSSPSPFRRLVSRGAIILAAAGLAACTDVSSPTRPSMEATTASFGKGGSPKSSHILFESNRDGNYEIYSMNADGSGQTRLTNNRANDNEAVYSPDNKRIAFFSTRDNGLGEIYVMKADGSGVTRLTNTTGASMRPSWSGDGSKIVFESTRDAADPTSIVGTNFEIYIMNADGTGVVRLTNNAYTDISPAWSPDGQYIAFASDRDHPGSVSARDLYLMNTDGTNVKRLTSQDGQLLDPAWDAKSQRIAYSVIPVATAPGIYVFDMGTQASTRLTFDPGFVDAWATWSPDGTQLAFAKYTNGSADIYLMNANGTGVTQITTNAANDSWPHWSR